MGLTTSIEAMIDGLVSGDAIGGEEFESALGETIQKAMHEGLREARAKGGKQLSMAHALGRRDRDRNDIGWQPTTEPG